MPLKLIQGPLNSGRRGLVLDEFRAVLDRDPILVVPNVDDVFEFERELCGGSAQLGGSVTTFGGLFREVVRVIGTPAGVELTPAQRLRAVEVGIASRRRGLGPLRESALRPGFAASFERFLNELQAAGLDPAQLSGSAETLESSAYLGDLAALAAGYTEARARLGRIDAHQIAAAAIDLLRDAGERWGPRSVFLYGLDDLTPNQLELLARLAPHTELTMALTFEEGRTALGARAGLLEQLGDRVGIAERTLTKPDPGNTPNPLLFHLERGFGEAEAEAQAPGDGLTLLRCAGLRGEAEAIGGEIAHLLAAEVDPAEIVVVLRDPARRGPQLAAVLESYGIATALEAEIPVAVTSVGGGLIALLEAEFGSGRASDVLRFLRGPSGIAPATVDWFERSLRRGRVQSAGEALTLWTSDERKPPRDLSLAREAADSSPTDLARAVGRLAMTMAARPMRGDGDGPMPRAGEAIELRAAATIASSLEELSVLGELCPDATELAATIAGLKVRAWSGPVAGRVRIADPYRLRAGRFDHVFVASLQDGEFPRRDRGGDPFLAEAQRTTLGLDPRRDTEAEERYLFYISLSLARHRLFLSWRDSDENGGAETPSPLLDDVRRLLAPPRPEAGPDPLEAEIGRTRDLTRVVHDPGSAPSENELARAVAVHSSDSDAVALCAAAGVEPETSERIGERIGAARRAEAAARAPGPLTNAEVKASLSAVSAYGGTTLEEFDLCSYRWFVGHELDPQLLEPVPDPLVQGGIMHSVLERLYGERPGGERLPRPASLPLWEARGRQLVGEECTARELGVQPAERAMARRVERLLIRFLGEEAERDPGSFQPWLLEARFGAGEESERPVLEIDGWGLHGAIDRVDRAPDGTALVLDYKLSSSVTPRQKFEEKAKLQLQLYLLAVAKHWGAEVIGGLYHPLRATSVRRPRGMVLDQAAGELSAYRLYDRDVVDEDEFEQGLDEARERAGEIVRRMRSGEIRRDPGPRKGLRDHDVCPTFCEFAPICRRERAPISDEDFEAEER